VSFSRSMIRSLSPGRASAMMRWIEFEPTSIAATRCSAEPGLGEML
jgi:hypothetical protein